MGTPIKTAEDRYSNKLQFGHISTPDYQNVTSAVAFNADYDQHVQITPVAAASWIGIESATFTPATSEGMLIKNGASYTTIIRKGEWIGASTEINVCPLGEL